MKYLVTLRPGPMPPPIEAARQAQDWVKARIDDGTFEVAYAFPEGGGLSIGEHGSSEQLMELMLDYPLAPFVDFDVKPLVDIDAAFDRLIPFMERVSAQLAGQTG